MRSAKLCGRILTSLVAASTLGAFASGVCATDNLLHRWSFAGDYADSVGGLTAVPSGAVAFNDTENPTAVRLTSTGAKTAYLNLGAGIVPAESSPVTVELWATQHSVKNWSRILDFGSNNQNYIMMSWTTGTDLNTDRVEIKKSNTAIVSVSNLTAPYTLNTAYHISLVLTPLSDGKTKLEWAKRDIATGTVLKSGSATTSQAWDPSLIAGWSNNYLGASQYADHDADASYDEVRIWKAALTPEQLTWSAQLGADLVPTTEATEGLTRTLTLTSENGTVSVDGTDGLGTGETTVPCVSDLRLVATPAEGYTFCRWEMDAAYITSGSATSREITVSTAHDLAVKAVFDVATVKYARYQNGAFTYLSEGKGVVEAPEGGMNDGVTIVFSSDAEYQALKTVPEEVAKAKGLELEANITLAADTDWSALDYSLGGNAIDINGKHFTTGSLAGEGGITSDGNIVANGTFEANTVASGGYVTMTPNGWRTGGSVVLIRNNRDHGDSECNNSNWCLMWNGANINCDFTVVQAGDYTFQFDVASRNASSTWKNSSIYAGFDGNNVINAYTGTWKSQTKKFTVPLSVGTHTLKIGCNGGGAVLVDNVLLYKSSTSTTPGILEVKVPEGKTVANDTVLIGGGNALQLWKTGKGELKMNKANNGYGAPWGYVSTVVKEGVLRKSPTVPTASCGAQYTTIEVDDGGTFDLQGRSYWDYQYILNGHGHDGKGALVNTVSAQSPWQSGSYGYLRNVEVGSDTTISGTEHFSMSFWQHNATTMTLNGHTVHYGGPAIIFLGNTSYAGTGRIVIDEDGTVESYAAQPSAPGATLEVRGVYQQQDQSLSPVGSLLFTETGKYNNPWDTRPAITVRNAYAPNLAAAEGSKAAHPTVTLGTADTLYTELDLSLFTDAFDASTTTFYAGTSVTVNFGARTLGENEKVVAWSALPAAADFVAAGENVGEIRLLAKEDGLYAVKAPAWAAWDLVNDTWNYYSSDGTPYPAEWTEGVTAEIDVHFASLAEFEAIKTQGVTPAKFVLTGLALAPGQGVVDLTTGFDFVLKPGLEIDLQGNRLKLPPALVGGAVPFTVTDSTSATEAPAIVAEKACFWLDALDRSTLAIDAEGKVQTWRSKDAKQVVATATQAPTYAATGYRFPTVDFGAVGSGLDMAYTRFTKLRTVFWVMRIAKHEGAFFLGDMSTYNFHRGSAGQYGNGSYHKFASLWNGTTAVNITGDTPSDTEFCVYSATMNVDACSDRLTTDRNCSSAGLTRTGGRQLSELICFETTLSDADRLAVVAYLQRKWFASADSGKLVVDVPEGATIGTANATLAGFAGLEKTGAGTLLLSRGSQAYSGGTQVTGGLLKLGNNSCLGVSGSEVTVGAEGTLELNGVYDLNAYSFVLDGGTLQNTAADIDSGKSQIAKLRLTADSTFKPERSYGLIGSGYSATTLDLGGHTLTVPLGVGKNFWLYNATVTAGTVDVTSGGWLVVDKTAVNAPETLFRVSCALEINVPFTVGGYETLYPADYNKGTGVMTVQNLFKPHTAYYRGVTLADGVCLDLSAYEGTWTAKSAFTEGANVVTLPAGTEEANATISVELHGRALRGAKIIGWDEESAPVFVDFVATEATRKDGRTLVVRGDGVYVTGGTVLILR